MPAARIYARPAAMLQPSAMRIERNFHADDHAAPWAGSPP